MTTTKTDWLDELCDFIKLGNIDAVKSILNEHQLPGHTGDDGEFVMAQSPLHLAILHEKHEILQLLLSHGVDVSVTNLYGETPLHVASRLGQTGIVEKLLNIGSQLDCKDCGEATPLFHAVYRSQSAAAEILIQAGANLDTLNEELITPLDHAITYNDNKMISILLRGGCSLDMSTGVVFYPGHYSNSILFSLWTNGDIENVTVLIDSGYRLTGSHVQNLFSVAKKLDWDDNLLKDVEMMIRKPVSLKRTCRIVIRRHLLKVKYMKRTPVQGLIHQLPLPPILKKYISML